MLWLRTVEVGLNGLKINDTDIQKKNFVYCRPVQTKLKKKLG